VRVRGTRARVGRSGARVRGTRARVDRSRARVLVDSTVHRADPRAPPADAGSNPAFSWSRLADPRARFPGSAMRPVDSRSFEADSRGSPLDSGSRGASRRASPLDSRSRRASAPASLFDRGSRRADGFARPANTGMHRANSCPSPRDCGSNPRLSRANPLDWRTDCARPHEYAREVCRHQSFSWGRAADSGGSRPDRCPVSRRSREHSRDSQASSLRSPNRSWRHRRSEGDASRGPALAHGQTRSGRSARMNRCTGRCAEPAPPHCSARLFTSRTCSHCTPAGRRRQWPRKRCRRCRSY
jgi:hypothetical protein